MIKIEKIDTYGWEAAVRGARNPMNSWDRSDSHYCDVYANSYFHSTKSCCCESAPEEFMCPGESTSGYILGKNDLDLLNRLSKAGTDHGKFMRMIGVTMDITAPLYWWKEASTYKVGTVENSCSTMHKIHAKEFTVDDFSTDHMTPLSIYTLKEVIKVLNLERLTFVNNKNKDSWWQMIQLLPSSYNQKRTWSANYAVLKNIYHARKDHKLDEWKEFCKVIEKLPYSELITGEENEDNSK